MGTPIPMPGPYAERGLNNAHHVWRRGVESGLELHMAFYKICGTVFREA